MSLLFRAGFLFLAVLFLAAAPASSQLAFVEFESGPVRPLTLSPDGNQLFAVNTPDGRLEVFSVSAGALTHTDSIPVGMEPVAVAARSNTELWVVNHLSDSVSIVDLAASPPQVVRTLLVGDEPRDIVFAGSPARAFITTAHRGQHLTHASLSGVSGAGDPQLTTSGIGRADVWVFDPTSLGTTLGGTPDQILTFFADTPRALAVSADGNTVYVAAFHSGNETTVINETLVPDGFGGNGVPGPSDNMAGDPAPETGIIVKKLGGVWRDSAFNNRNALVPFNLPDHDVFSIDANTLAPGSIVAFDHVGTILFNMVVNPVSGKVYVTNTELPNHVDFEGPGNYGGSTVQGHLSETRISVLTPGGPTVDPQHLNQHIDYLNLHTDTPDLVDVSQIGHSLATPLQSVVSSDGLKIYLAAFGSAKIGVFNAADIEDPSFELNFDPTVESANYLATGGGPAGLALDEGNNVLYVWTRFDNAVSVIDLANGATTQTHALHNPEPPSVIDGRPFLYDAVNTSGNGEASCASCHIFADFDSLAWNLGNPDDVVSTNSQPSSSSLAPSTVFHPMKGPMTTQTLRGMATHGGMHWRGDRVDGFFGLDPCTEPSGAPCNEDHAFRNFIVAFEGLVGHDGILGVSEVQQFSDFALQLFLPPNPVRALDNSLTASQQSGKTTFNVPITDTVETCNGCHNLSPIEGFFGSGGEQSFEGEPQHFKVPHIRNMYQKVGMFSVPGNQVRGFGFLHDGSVDTLATFVSAPLFSLNPTEEANLEQFSLAFDSDLAPIVGQQVTLDASNGGVINPRIDMMIARAGTPFQSLMLGGNLAGECDVIVKGSVAGVPHGWVLLAGTGLFLDDLAGSTTDAALRALAISEGPLTYTAVPPGSGTRMGIDRDGDTLVDGFETNTGIFVGPSNTGSDPADPDSDNDGFDDGVEVAAGTDPNNPLDFPGGGPPAVPSMDGVAGGMLVGAMLASARYVLRRRRD